jgi:ElaB/YqjD/DUF883 family membrane-anchored ribosome-binding protein
METETKTNAETVESVSNSIVKSAQDLTQDVIKSTQDVVKSTQDAIKSTQDAVQESKPIGFLESDSFIAKISFLFLIIIGFYVILHLGIYLLSVIITNSTSPKIVSGMINAKNNALIFPQSPSLSNSIPIYKSENASDGIEFTWSIWLFINNVGSTYQHIFNKGNSNIQTDGLSEPNNAPGLYISPNKNQLLVLMNTFEIIDENIIIPDIPMNKWVSVIIICKNNELNIYVNGVIAKSHLLQGVPKQNYGDINVALNGGFDGYISDLFYHNYALGIQAIQSLVNKGPNTTMSSSGTSTLPTSNKSTDYLSLRWYLNGG